MVNRSGRILLNLHMNSYLPLEYNLEMQEGGPSQWMDQKIDKSCYRTEIAKDFSPLMILAMSSLTIALKQFYEYPEYLDSIRKRFLKSLDILRWGSYAEREPDIGEG